MLRRKEKKERKEKKRKKRKEKERKGKERKKKRMLPFVRSWEILGSEEKEEKKEKKKKKFKSWHTKKTGEEEDSHQLFKEADVTATTVAKGANRSLK